MCRRKLCCVRWRVRDLRAARGTQGVRGLPPGRRRGWRRGGREHAEPAADLVARQATVRHGRDPWQCRRGSWPRHSDRAQSSRLQVGQHEPDTVPHQVQAPADQVDVGRGPPSAVGHVQHLHPCSHAEEFPRKMEGRADSGGPVGENPGLGLGEHDQLARGLGRHAGVRHQHEWKFTDLDNRRKIAHGTVVDLEEMRGCRHP